MIACAYRKLYSEEALPTQKRCIVYQCKYVHTSVYHIIQVILFPSIASNQVICLYKIRRACIYVMFTVLKLTHTNIVFIVFKQENTFMCYFHRCVMNQADRGLVRGDRRNNFVYRYKAKRPAQFVRTEYLY